MGEGGGGSEQELTNTFLLVSLVVAPVFFPSMHHFSFTDENE